MLASNPRLELAISSRCAVKVSVKVSVRVVRSLSTYGECLFIQPPHALKTNTDHEHSHITGG
jgi:hypothetical protein